MDNTPPRFRSLSLAGYGWMPADWPMVFYPDDLPESWRVSYYANEFNSILLPAEGWRKPLLEAAFWQSEVTPDFRFYLEITQQLLQGDGWVEVQAAVERYLAGQVTGLLVEADVADMLPADWQKQFPIHLLKPATLLAEMPVGADAQTGVLRTPQALTPLALRGVFEALQQSAVHRDIVLFLDVPWNTLEQIRLMQQIYGIWASA
ncbi:MAG: hypothetical protein R3E93_14085 [Thiothrix sp.]